MKSKKSESANLEKRRGLFFSLGLVICSSGVLMAFTYSSAADNTSALQEIDNGLQEEFVYEFEEEPEIPEEIPEEAPAPVIITQVNIVNNNIEIDPFDFFDPNDVEFLPEDENFTVIEDEPIVDYAEIEPAFPGGEGAMMEWIQQNVVYPQEAIEMGEQGTVYVKFVVNTDGSIEQVGIARGISESLDTEATSVVKDMPKWTPGEQAGKAVRCRFTLPINFIFN